MPVLSPHWSFKTMSKELMNKKDIDRAVTRMAHEILEKNKGMEKLCLVGIQRGGVFLAQKARRKNKAD